MGPTLIQTFTTLLNTHKSIAPCIYYTKVKRTRHKINVLETRYFFVWWRIVYTHGSDKHCSWDIIKPSEYLPWNKDSGFWHTSDKTFLPWWGDHEHMIWNSKESTQQYGLGHFCSIEKDKFLVKLVFNSQITSDYILVQQRQIHSITTVSSVSIPTFSKVIFKDKKTRILAFRNIPKVTQSITLSELFWQFQLGSPYVFV